MSLIRKHGAVLQAWACLDLVPGCYRDSRLVGPAVEIGRRIADITEDSRETTRSCFRGCPWHCKGETRSHS